MQIFRGLHHPGIAPSCALTIGNVDGVHRGHQSMLARLNREIGSDFELSAFAHRARYNPMAGRIETHIVSRCEQQVKIGRNKAIFRADEAIQVEYSCKYSLADFAALAEKAGLAVQRVWTDPQQMFSVQYLARVGADRR